VRSDHRAEQSIVFWRSSQRVPLLVTAPTTDVGKTRVVAALGARSYVPATLENLKIFQTGGARGDRAIPSVPGASRSCRAS